MGVDGSGTVQQVTLEVGSSGLIANVLIAVGAARSLRQLHQDFAAIPDM